MLAARPATPACAASQLRNQNACRAPMQAQARVCLHTACVTVLAHRRARREVLMRAQASTDSDSRAVSIVMNLGRAYAQVQAPARHNITYTAAVQVCTTGPGGFLYSPLREHGHESCSDINIVSVSAFCMRCGAVCYGLCQLLAISCVAALACCLRPLKRSSDDLALLSEPHPLIHLSRRLPIQFFCRDDVRLRASSTSLLATSESLALALHQFRMQRHMLTSSVVAQMV